MNDPLRSSTIFLYNTPQHSVKSSSQFAHPVQITLPVRMYLLRRVPRP
jgi:hypothetical protein